ncbi:uncharacterized protein EDB91DRAFT_1082915 [Suillus paluster]|uniref:uncharacterized protein n=1 Tax=Suillus paluster TaxID=48578 RepID=UPI001B85CB2C|nr:uncharacterized protein EDB91DRAFT_1082915 [Suillus paluster]KAG1738166.1 hypothetical protein EDB91DRAFT_1082915 [Suillus paluster]
MLVVIPAVGPLLAVLFNINMDRHRHSSPVLIVLAVVGPLLIVLLGVYLCIALQMLPLAIVSYVHAIICRVVPEVLRGFSGTMLMEQVQSRIAVDATARQLLAEATLEAGTTNPDTHYFGDFNINSDQDNMEAEDEHEEEGDEGDSEGHPRSYFQALCDQFAIVFDVYLNILRQVQEKVNIALKRDSPDWCILHACPACDYKQENKSILLPGRMDSIDGNNSLKRVDGSGHADKRIFRSSYLIPASKVDGFKDDVRLRPGTRRVTENPTPADATESICTNNWKTANMITDNTIKVFEQTGIFTIVEMQRSGELAKYTLATTNRILDVYGPNGATGYDIGCSYQATVNASSISAKACSHQHHGLGLKDLETCERVFSGSNTVAPVIRHASYFHWLQFIDLHFRQWDADRYLELSKVFQVLDIQENFLENVAEESDEDIKAMAYVEALESLTRAQAAYGSITTVQFLTYTPADFTPSHGLQKDQQVFARAREAEWNAAYRKLLVEMNAFIRVIEQLQGLVVQRLFELAKANIAGTGYKLRQHISSAISRRSAAICTVLERYNRLAPVQTPPHEMLELSDIASYAWRDFTSREEIQQLNIEVGQLAARVDDEDAHLQSTFKSLLESDPALSHEIHWLRWVEKERIVEGDAAEMMADLRGARSIEADKDDDLCDEKLPSKFFNEDNLPCEICCYNLPSKFCCSSDLDVYVLCVPRRYYVILPQNRGANLALTLGSSVKNFSPALHHPKIVKVEEPT